MKETFSLDVRICCLLETNTHFPNETGKEGFSYHNKVFTEKGPFLFQTSPTAEAYFKKID